MSRPIISNDNLVRISFQLDPSESQAGGWEGLWSEPVHIPGAIVYRLLNSPFYAKTVSYLDLVKGMKDPECDRLIFDAVWRHSGHSTYMIYTDPTFKDFTPTLEALCQLGCSWESGEEPNNGMLYSLDIPPETDIFLIYRMLEDSEFRNEMTFQEGFVGHKVPR